MRQHTVEITTIINEDSHPASAETLSLLASAREAAHRAYAPYSRFRVGAAALLDNGEVVVGCNQENAAYPSGLCAERVAVFYANARYPEARVLRLMIYAETDEGPLSQPITPCGACRQVILEKETTQGCNIAVTLAGRSDLYHIPSVGCLLPLKFDKLTN